MITAVLNPLLMISLPVLLGILLSSRLRTEWRLYALGMVTFVASQVLHIPFNQWLLNPLLQRLAPNADGGGAALVVVAVFLVLSAGVFEETARLLMLLGPLRKARSWRDGLMFGAGHGGVEAILLGLLSFYALVQLVALRDVDLAATLAPSQVETVRTALTVFWGMPWYEHLIPTLERVFAICLHLGLTILVLQALTRRNWLWFGLAVLWHALVDAVAVFALPTWGVYITEGLVAIFGLLSLALVWLLRDRAPEPAVQAAAEQATAPSSPGGATPSPLAVTIPTLQTEPDAQAIENSRYQSGG
jgi:uncharacterized membrane protein YhfC